MLHSILQNLFSNAIKFSYKGGTIKINSKELGELVELQIADNGIGISKDNIDKIFEIGTQFTTVGTADEKGTGLGLLLCKEMVEKHGGMIRVQSELKKGTTFIFTLPKYSN
jgi:Signal transduction histidine kinase